VHLSLPQDALDGPADLESVPSSASFMPEAMPLDDGIARDIATRLANARSPLILAGPWAMRGEAAQRATALENATGIPVIGMESPRGVGDPSLGALAQVLLRGDLVLLLGKRLDFTLKFGAAFSDACTFLQIDPEGDELERTRRAMGPRLLAAAVADGVSSLRALAHHAKPSEKGWREEVRDALAWRPAAWDHAGASSSGRLHPVQAFRPLQALLDTHADSVFVCDGGEIGQWAQACLRAPNRVINGVAGSIGAALPFALAARLARPGAPVVAVMGDGTFGFHPAEIDTAVRYRLPFVAIVGNDARWNAEYQIQVRDYGADRTVGCELLPARYDEVAKGFGGHGELVTEASQLLPAVQRAIAAKLPAVLNVMVEGLPAPNLKRP